VRPLGGFSLRRVEFLLALAELLARLLGYPVAVYRDDDGEMHARSAVCPHMGCLVSWNDGERSWDCPCHGSRFDIDGEVLDTPAVDGLGDVSMPDGPDS